MCRIASGNVEDLAHGEDEEGGQAVGEALRLVVEDVDVVEVGGLVDVVIEDVGGFHSLDFQFVF